LLLPPHKVLALVLLNEWLKKEEKSSFALEKRKMSKRLWKSSRIIKLKVMYATLERRKTD
jgi:hypothetical protein